jgi:hypothetical protein
VFGDRVAPWESVGAAFGQYYAVGATDTTNLGTGFVPAGGFFKGRVADFRVWNAARSDADILDTRNTRLTGNEPGLVSYWKLNDLVKTTVIDSSARHVNGIAIGGVILSAGEAPSRVRGPLHIDALDLDLDRVFLSAESGDPHVTVQVTDGQLFITPAAGFGGTARITVFATDRNDIPGDHRGRRALMSFDFTTDPVAIYGNKWNDLNADGVHDEGEPALDGVLIFADLNGNGALDTGEQSSYTDINGDYALRNVPFQASVPATAAQLIASQSVTPGGGAQQTVHSSGATLETTTTSTAALNFLVRTNDGKLHTGIIELTPTMTADNNSLADLAADVNEQIKRQSPDLSGAVRAVVLSDADFRRLAFEVIDVTGDFNKIQEGLRIISSTDVRSSQDVRFADGSVRHLSDGLVTITGALGFDSPQIATGVQVLIAAGAETEGKGGVMKTASTQDGTDTTVTRTEVTLVVGVNDVQKSLVLTPELTGDNQTPEALLQEIRDFLSANTLDALVLADLDGGGLRFTTSNMGGDQSLHIAVLTHNHSERTVVFDGETFIDDVLLDETLDGGLGFGGIQSAQGTDVSFNVVEVPPAGWAPTTHPTALASGEVGTQSIAFDIEGQVLQGIDFGNVLVAQIDMGGDLHANEGTAVTITPSVIDPLGRAEPPFIYVWHVSSDNGQEIADSSGSSFTFTPYDNGLYTVRLGITDTERGLTAYPDTLVVTAENVPPALEAGEDTTVDEGQSFDLSVAFSDPGTHDTHSALVNWGDDTTTVFESLEELDGAGTLHASHVFADNGQYKVSVSITDDDGASTTDSLVVTVNNVAPVVDAGDDRSIDEGALFSLQSLGVIRDGAAAARLGDITQIASGGVIFHDGGTLDSHSATIDWGDGTQTETGGVSELPFGPPGSSDGLTGRVFGTHIYADNGQYTVTIIVTDDDGDTASDSLVVTVNNAAPGINAGANQEATEGQIIQLDPATFSDAGSRDTHNATIDWGDGQVEAGVIAEAPFGPPGSPGGMQGTISGSHVYADDGEYVVTITLTDDDGAQATGQATFTVFAANADPAVDAGPNITVNEGDLVTLPAAFTDAGTADHHSASVNWGDGEASDAEVTESPFGPPGDPAGMSGAVSATHTYFDNGIYTGSVSVSDDDGGTGSDGFTVTVRNVAPIVTAGPDQSVDEGATVTVAGHFTDPGVGDTHTATINWGDGTVENAQIVLGESGRIAFGSHLYVDDNVYTVTLSVRDNDGDEGSDSLLVTVRNTPPVTDAGPDRSVSEGVPLTLLASFTDLGAGDVHHGSIDWGDGTFTAGIIEEQGSGGTISGTHTYADNATFTVSVTIFDDDNASSTDTTSVIVDNVAPLVRADNFSVDEDHVLTVGGPGVLGNDTDVPADPLTAALVTGALHGNVVLLSNGGFTYTPDADFAGVDTFAYHAADDDSGTSQDATVTVNVNPTNDAPSFISGADQTVLEDSGAQTVQHWAGGISTGPADESGQALHFIVNNDNPALFSVQPALDAEGALTYTTAANAFGTAHVSVQLQDNGGTDKGGHDTSATQAFSITVVPVNDAPVPEPLQISGDEDHAIFGQLHAQDVDGDTLTFTVFIGAGQGTVDVAADGTFTYTPNANFFGEDGFAFLVSDGTVSSEDFGTVSITINPVNDAPTGVSNIYQVREDSALTISQRALGVLGNDSDVDDLQTTLTAQLLTGPGNGTVQFHSNGTFVYTPTPDFAGNDSFTYRAVDPHGAVSASTTVTLAVQNVNDAPIAADSRLTADEDTPAIAAFHAADIDSPTLTFTVVNGPAHGAVQVIDGNYTYTPAPDFFGSDSFTFRASDGELASNLATVSITVNPVNDAPVAQGDLYAVDEDSSLVVSVASSGVLANDRDIEGDALKAVLVSGPLHGTVQMLDNGTFTYTPVPDFFGSDSFTYKANDGALDSATATVAINVAPTPDAPKLAAVAAGNTASEGQLFTMTMSASDVDLPADHLTFGLLSGPANAKVDAVSGVFSWTPNEQQGPGVQNFTIGVTDAFGLTDSTGFAVQVFEDSTIDAGRLANNGQPDSFRLFRDGNDIKVELNGTLVFVRAIGGLTGLSVNGSNDNDTLVVDFSGGNPIPAAGIAYDGRGAGDHDTLTLTGGAAGNVVYGTTGPGSGSVGVDGRLLSYAHLEPIHDDLAAASRRFVFGSGSDAINLAIGATRSLLSSPSSETVDFVNPSDWVRINAGGGNDTITLSGQQPAFEVQIDGGAGNNAIHGNIAATALIEGTDAADQIKVAQSAGQLTATVNAASGTTTGAARLRVNGLGGDDSITLKGISIATNVDAGAGNDTADASGVSAVGVVLLGSDGNDVLIGGSAGDRLEGGAGNDFLRGGPGDDVLIAGDGNDKLQGEAGKDVLDGGAGNDTAVVNTMEPVAYWSLNETSGTLIKDLAGKPQNGTFYGSKPDLGEAGPPAALAPFGAKTAAGFEHASSDYIAVADDAEFQIPNGTIQFWFRTDNAGRDQTLLAKDHKGVGAGQLRIGIDSRDLVVDLEGNGKTYTIDTDHTKFNDLVKSETWYQLTFTFGAGGMKLFLDGMLVGTNAYTGGLIGNHEALVIGAGNQSNADVSGNLAKLKISNPVDGVIDEVAVLASALSSQQIQQTRERGPAGVIRPEDLGTIDGTDTLISVEKVGFVASAPTASAAATQLSAARTNAPIAAVSITAPSVPAIQSNGTAAANAGPTIDWSVSVKDFKLASAQDDGSNAVQSVNKTRSPLGWVKDFVYGSSTGANVNSKLRLKLPTSSEVTRKITRL